MMEQSDIPDWLKSSDDYRPGTDRDGFVMRSMLSITSVLAQLREVRAQRTRLSPTTAVRLSGCLVCVLLVSLARNYLFVVATLACLLVRMCLLPRKALWRVASGALAAAGLALVVSLPAVLIGQPRSALTLATKSLTSVGMVLTVAATTPVGELMDALRAMGVPAQVILTLNLALNGIFRLGETALEVLQALRLRSVGVNHHKQASMGGIGGVVLLKAERASQDTYDAMRCRGFDGSYRTEGAKLKLKPVDALWISLLAALVALFVVTQRMV
jgi:cobalt/nickel transport system permease protein